MSKTYSYIAAIFLIIGITLLRFTLHEDVYVFPIIMVVIGVILLIIAKVKGSVESDSIEKED